MGIRLALGASPGSLRRRVMAETLTFAATGLAIGLFVAWGLARAMTGLLFGVGGLDAATFLAASALLSMVAALAGLVPAAAAARADPTETLRAGG
jgi:ABC-type antimicrobial peptide transport system permease subunit